MIPDRWHNYTPCGTVVQGTCFICFKTPLHSSLFEYVTNEEDHWTVPILIARHTALGAVIDLTNTTRYYDGAQLMRAGVLYKKIRVPGRALPDENIVQTFFDAVDEFRDCCPTMLIGVHCTHGLNRSGYLVCRYMVDCLGVSPAHAIHRFETARGHTIENAAYLQDLILRKNAQYETSKRTLNNK
ncbi:PTP-1 [Dione juno nucleopolyhedrovirus]|uniref:PTP-1 n=1 Tax=Dione juno nucleopolyhedrovirus TaxID=2594175 RepID=A0AAE6H2T2_9ABAC|nr:PTP-1 [Dione juno nucleopolyhedrovirus]QDL57001.1 PTP-1 [Dione juno nucleopolyhedrovirus]